MAQSKEEKTVYSCCYEARQRNMLCPNHPAPKEEKNDWEENLRYHFKVKIPKGGKHWIEVMIILIRNELQKSYEQGKQETCMAYDETYWTNVIGKNRREAKQEERNRIIGLIDEMINEFHDQDIDGGKLKSKINQ